MELYCTACGYGISVVTVPECCPMCRTARWEVRSRRSLEELARDFVPGQTRVEKRIERPAL
jgi:hypothetical protein